MRQNTIEKFWANVAVAGPDECWLWQLYKDAHGYGTFRFAGRKQYAHRIAYTNRVGSIPDGLVIDHLCGVKACCNPAHLEPVNNATNSRRGGRTHGTRKQMCKNGHLTTPENTVIWRNGKVRCRTCTRAGATRHNHRRRAPRSDRRAV